VNPVAEVIDALGLTHAGTYLALFLAASLVMLWRLEALLDHGLEGTALGTLVLPYCSGLGNLVFVFLVARGTGTTGDIVVNCLVNNVTNLTLLLGLPALLWGLPLVAIARPSRPARPAAPPAAGPDPAIRLTQLSLLLTLTAVLFFTGLAWVLGSDGRLDRRDGLTLVAVFFFWQSFQVFDVLKHNVRRRRGFGPLFYLDLFVVLLGAAALYASLDWLVAWLAHREVPLLGPASLGWLTGWLMVLPNAVPAFYYAARRRADVVYASQIGDGHICIPLCLGLAALVQPVALPPFYGPGLLILAGAAALHLGCVAFAGGLPRAFGWLLLAAHAGFLAAGLM
jgi:cation:H+ antiporter